jgi:hypothetical protein
LNQEFFSGSCKVRLDVNGWISYKWAFSTSGQIEIHVKLLPHERKIRKKKVLAVSGDRLREEERNVRRHHAIPHYNSVLYEGGITFDGNLGLNVVAP